MLRFAITDLPPLDLAGDVMIGSGASAQVRLPAAAARAEHVRVRGGDGEARWEAIGDVLVDGTARHGGDAGTVAIADGATVKIVVNDIEIVVGRSPVGASESGPMRTASLARELVRGLLGDGGVPTLAVEQGPMAGTSRALPPPVTTIVIGRGDEAGWVILDSDLSRSHAEIRRDWDGVHVRDLGSKNGTRLDGAAVSEAGSLMADGGLLELGSVQLRFSDPAEAHLRGDMPLPQAAIRLKLPSIPPSMTGGKRRSGKASVPPIAVEAMALDPAAAGAAAEPAGRSAVFWVALAIAGAAIGTAIWILIG